MTGPATPGQEGPSFAPPQLPEGWIAQWDGHSRKYYFVQLATGVSQWETPIQAAPTCPTPQATPQGIDHPYGAPGEQLDVINNPDGSQSVRTRDGKLEPMTNDRSLSGNIGQFAMNQLLGGGKKTNHGSSGGGGGGGGGGLGSLAGQFLGGSSHGGSGSGSGQSGNPAAGIAGTLVNSFLSSGKKPEKTNYSGSQNQPHIHGSGGGGMMGLVGGLFGGHGSQQGNNFGYSQNNNHQGGYSGSAPPTSYQPSGSVPATHNPPPLPQEQHNVQSYIQSHSQGSQHQQQLVSPNTGHAYGSSEHHYTGGQSGYGGQPPPYRPQYGGGQQPQYQQQAPGSYPSPPSHSGPQPSFGNLSAPEHHHFLSLHKKEHTGGLYGNGSSGVQHLNSSHSYQAPPQGSYGAPGGYGGQQRW